MSPNQAARLAAHARRLRAAHILTVYDHAVLDTMLWRLRRPGFGNFTADYKSIAKLAGVCRTVAIKAVNKLQELGLLAKTCRRVRVMWGARKGIMSTASRQISNAYVLVLLPDTESVSRAADKGIGSESTKPMESKVCLQGIEAALAGLAAASGLGLRC